jgi:type IV pilus assembly protein PilC
MRSGISVVESLKQGSRRGPAALREASDALAAALAGGADVGSAVSSSRAYFPPLFIQLSKVGVETGHFPEVLRELEKYYRLQVSLRQRLVQQITWPVFQLVMAILVIALVIYLLGILPAVDVLGLGLKGGSGVMIWLGGWGAAALTGFIGYQAARNKLGQAERIDEILLRTPVLGPVVRTLALARVALAMHLTMESGMSLKRAIPLSLSASDNAAIARSARPIVEAIKDGRSLSEAFAEQNLFSDELIDVLANAEEAGRVPEAMNQLAAEMNQRAEHQLALLNQALGWLVWLIVAGIIILFIMRIAMVAYLGPLYDALDELPG